MEEQHDNLLVGIVDFASSEVLHMYICKYTLDEGNVCVQSFIFALSLKITEESQIT